MIPNNSKEDHYRLILKSLIDANLISLEIASKTGLTQHQVSRRMSELREQSKVKEVGLKPVLRNGINRNFTVYSLK